MKNIDINPNKPIFPISVVADILGVHQRTCRIYDEEGILVPGRSPKNRRLYSMDDIEKGKLIQFLSKDLGVNIIGIKIILRRVPNILNTPELFKSEIVKELGITPEMIIEKNNKLSKRGRKPFNAS